MGCTGHIEIIADDEALSGTLDIHKRPGLSRVVRLIEEEGGRRIGWIGAVHVNRLTRDPWLITPAHLMKQCYERDVWIATLRMPFDFKDDYCQRVFMLEAEEPARHLQWMKVVLGGGKNAASNKGYYDGRFLSPGYIVDRTDPLRKRYIIYRPHADVVSWLFTRYFELDGNFPALREEVAAMTYLFPAFESWVDRKNIRKFLVKEIADGAYKGNYKPSERGLRSILTNPVYIGWWITLEGGLIENNHEPVVDEWLFTYAHKRLSTHDLNGERQKPGVTRICYFKAARGTGSQWTAEEEQVLWELYPAGDVQTIMTLLPDRSWVAIINHARVLQIDRVSSSRSPRGVRVEDRMALRDEEFLKAYGLSGDKKVHWFAYITVSHTY